MRWQWDEIVLHLDSVSETPLATRPRVDVATRVLTVVAVSRAPSGLTGAPSPDFACGFPFVEAFNFELLSKTERGSKPIVQAGGRLMTLDDKSNGHDTTLQELFLHCHFLIPQPSGAI